MADHASGGGGTDSGGNSKVDTKKKRTDDLPSGCCCPITQEPFVDPVMCADGHTYSREAITSWISYGRCTSPMTGLRLESLVLVPNHAMRIVTEQILDTRARDEWAEERSARGCERIAKAWDPQSGLYVVR